MQRRGKHVRLFKSGENDAHKIFKELSKQGKIYFKDEEKIVVQLSDDIYITYRSVSVSGPPTININLPKFDIIKFKFIEE